MAFDPFKDGGATAVADAPATSDFDPFKAGATPVDDSGFDPFKAGATPAQREQDDLSAQSKEADAAAVPGQETNAARVFNRTLGGIMVHKYQGFLESGYAGNFANQTKEQLKDQDDALTAQIDDPDAGFLDKLKARFDRWHVRSALEEKGTALDPAVVRQAGTPEALADVFKTDPAKEDTFGSKASHVTAGIADFVGEGILNPALPLAGMILQSGAEAGNEAVSKAIDAGETDPDKLQKIREDASSHGQHIAEATIPLYMLAGSGAGKLTNLLKPAGSTLARTTVGTVAAIGGNMAASAAVRKFEGGNLLPTGEELANDVGNAVFHGHSEFVKTGEAHSIIDGTHEAIKVLDEKINDASLPASIRDAASAVKAEAQLNANKALGVKVAADQVKVAEEAEQADPNVTESADALREKALADLQTKVAADHEAAAQRLAEETAKSKADEDERLAKEAEDRAKAAEEEAAKNVKATPVPGATETPTGETLGAEPQGEGTTPAPPSTEGEAPGAVSPAPTLEGYEEWKKWREAEGYADNSTLLYKTLTPEQRALRSETPTAPTPEPVPSIFESRSKAFDAEHPEVQESNPEAEKAIAAKWDGKRPFMLGKGEDKSRFMVARANASEIENGSKPFKLIDLFGKVVDGGKPDLRFDTIEEAAQAAHRRGLSIEPAKPVVEAKPPEVVASEPGGTGGDGKGGSGKPGKQGTSLAVSGDQGRQTGPAKGSVHTLIERDGKFSVLSAMPDDSLAATVQDFPNKKAALARIEELRAAGYKIGEQETQLGLRPGQEPTLKGRAKRGNFIDKINKAGVADIEIPVPIYEAIEKATDAVMRELSAGTGQEEVIRSRYENMAREEFHLKALKFLKKNPDAKPEDLGFFAAQKQGGNIVKQVANTIREKREFQTEFGATSTDAKVGEEGDQTVGDSLTADNTTVDPDAPEHHRFIGSYLKGLAERGPEGEMEIAALGPRLVREGVLDRSDLARVVKNLFERAVDRVRGGEALSEEEQIAQQQEIIDKIGALHDEANQRFDAALERFGRTGEGKDRQPLSLGDQAKDSEGNAGDTGSIAGGGSVTEENGPVHDIEAERVAAKPSKKAETPSGFGKSDDPKNKNPDGSYRPTATFEPRGRVQVDSRIADLEPAVKGIVMKFINSLGQQFAGVKVHFMDGDNGEHIWADPNYTGNDTIFIDPNEFVKAWHANGSAEAGKLWGKRVAFEEVAHNAVFKQIKVDLAEQLGRQPTHAEFGEELKRRLGAIADGMTDKQKEWTRVNYFGKGSKEQFKSQDMMVNEHIRMLMQLARREAGEEGQGLTEMSKAEVQNSSPAVVKWIKQLIGKMREFLRINPDSDLHKMVKGADALVKEMEVGKPAEAEPSPGALASNLEKAAAAKPRTLSEKFAHDPVQTYEERGAEVRDTEARAYLARYSPQEAAQRLAKGSDGLAPDTLVTARRLAITAAREAGRLDLVKDLQFAAAEAGTLHGQAVQANVEWTPENSGDKYVKTVTDAQDPLKPKKGDKGPGEGGGGKGALTGAIDGVSPKDRADVAEVKDTIDTARTDAADTTTGKSDPLIDRVVEIDKGATGATDAEVTEVEAATKAIDDAAKTPEPPATPPAEGLPLDEGPTEFPVKEDVLQRVAKINEDRVMKALGLKGKKQDKPFLQILQDEVAKQVKAQMDAQLNLPKESKPGEGLMPGDQSDLKRITDSLHAMVNSGDLAEKAFNQAIADLGARGITIEGAKFDRSKVEGVAKFVQRRGNLREVVRRTLADRDASLQQLKDIFTNEVKGLTPDQVDLVSRSIEATFNEEAQKEAKKQLDAMVSRRGIVKLAPKSATDRLLQLVNLGAMSDKKYYDAVAPSYNLPAYDPKVATEIHDRAMQVQQLMADDREGFQVNTATRRLLSYIEDQTRSGADKWISLLYAHVLSGPTTHVRNILGNITQLAGEVGTMQLATHGTNPLPFAHTLAAMGKGLGKGTIEAIHLLLTGEGGQKIGTDAKLGGLHALESNPFGDPMSALKLVNWIEHPLKTLKSTVSAAKVVMRAMEAADMVFYRGAQEARAQMMAEDQVRTDPATKDLPWAERSRLVAEMLHGGGKSIADLRTEAIAKADAEGLTGLRKAMRVGELIEQKRPQDIRESSDSFAARATYNHTPEGFLGEIGKGIDQVSANYKALKLIVPFTKIVANVTNAAIDYTPFGVFRSGIVPGFKGWETRNAGDQRTQQLIKVAAGTAAMAAIYALGGKDDDSTRGKPEWRVHGAGPSDPNARKQLVASGWMPYSIETPWGFMSYQNHPASVGLAIVGNVRDAQRYQNFSDKDVQTRLAFAVANSASVITSQSFLSGVADLMQTLSQNTVGGESKGFTNFLSRTASSILVPNFIKQVDRFFDPTTYKADSLLETMYSEMPLARKTLNPAINALGEPVARSPIDQFTVKRSSDPVWSFLVQKGLVIPGVSTSAKIGDRIMTGDEVYQMTKESGQMLRKFLDDPNNRQEIGAIPTDQAQKVLDSVSSAYRAATMGKLMEAAYRRGDLYKGQ